MIGMSVALYGQEEQKAAPEDSAKVAQKYQESFGKTGVPTPEAVDAALAKAKKANTIESWEYAAGLADSYANVVEVLREHYATLYNSSRAGRAEGNKPYMRQAADYEKSRNQYLGIRNDVYLNIADLYLAKGNKSVALSYAMTAVQLTSAELNVRGVNLIKKIIEYR